MRKKKSSVDKLFDKAQDIMRDKLTQTRKERPEKTMERSVFTWFDEESECWLCLTEEAEVWVHTSTCGWVKAFDDSRAHAPFVELLLRMRNLANLANQIADSLESHYPSQMPPYEG